MNSSYFVIALLKCSGIGTAKALKFILKYNKNLDSCMKNVNEIVNHDEFKLNMDRSVNEVQSNLNKNINLITIFDKEFPSRLYTISEPVLYLYYMGDVSLLNMDSVTIIGTRHPNETSVVQTKFIAEKISKKYVVVSGLALGIDSIVHQTTLDFSGKTIAVLPSSIDNIQPISNRQLAKNIVEKCGLLISEYSTGNQISKFNYAKRDRIQAALASVLIVTEAKEDSGTMIAVEKAFKEFKNVYQLSSNNNSKINKSFDIDDDFMKLIDDSVINYKNLEEEKINKLLNDNTIKQIALF